MTFREIRYDVEDGVCTVMAAPPVHLLTRLIATA